MSYSAPIPRLLDISAGHRRALQQILEFIRRGECCALLGPRLSGTTELLQCVVAELSHDPACTCVYVDLKRSKPSTRKAFFASLARMTSKAVAEHLGRPAFRPLPKVVSGAHFRTFLALCASELERNLVLVVDNMHSVSNDLIQALLTSLRAAYMEQESGGPLVVPVVCGAFSLAALTVGQSSPFANVARTVFVGGLSDSESAALIHDCTTVASVTVSDGACDSLLRATRGDPRLIERVCRICVRIATATQSLRITASTVRRAVREFIQNQAASYEPFVEAVSLIEDDPDLLRCILLLLERELVPRSDLPLQLSPDMDALSLTGMVREGKGGAFQVQNGIYREFLTRHFQPSRVGYLMALAGRWDTAIDYLEDGLGQSKVDTRSDLLAATVNAMYASHDVREAARYLVRGLALAFGVEQASIWHAGPQEKHLKLIGQLGLSADRRPAPRAEISTAEDGLEARAYQEARALRGRESHGSIERALPLLLSASKSVGVVTIVDQVEGVEPGAQRERDLRLLGYLSQAARAVEEVRIRRDQLLRIDKLEQERTAQELRLAREIQVSFLPERCPTRRGWEICADWRAAREVGGDFYDFIPLDSQHLGLVIGDVSDKGMPAALFMSLCRTLVRVSAGTIRSPAQALQHVNELLMAESRSGMFLTVFYGVLNWREGYLTYANAGHNPPILWRCPRHGAEAGKPTGGATRDLRDGGAEVVPLAAKGIVLGVIDDVELEQRQVSILPEDILILYTDGVTEPINAQEEEFGERRLVDVVAANCDKPCSQIVEAIYAAVSDFVGDYAAFDDYTLVGAKRIASS